ARHPARTLQPYRRHPEHALELLVTLLHERLVLVLRQRLFQAQRLVVGHQREQPVAERLRRQRRPVLVKMYPISPPLYTSVRRVRPRPTRPYLTKSLLHLRFDTDTQPALGPLPLQNLHARPVRLAIRAERPAAGSPQPLQPGPRPLQARL